LFGGGVTDDDDFVGLKVAGRGGVVGGLEDTMEIGVGDGTVLIGADGIALFDDGEKVHGGAQ
jgi:hypothetical protein